MQPGRCNTFSVPIEINTALWARKRCIRMAVGLEEEVAAISIRKEGKEGVEGEEEVVVEEEGVEEEEEVGVRKGKEAEEARKVPRRRKQAPKRNFKTTATLF